MLGRRIVLIVGLVVLGAAFASRFGGPSQAAVSSTLHASVGPGFDISLTFDDGTKVTSAPAGTYRVVVNDTSNDHNFHLFGPGVGEQTGVEQVGSVSWTVTFQSNARYVFQCDIHADDMSGTVTVGSPPDESSGSGGSGGSGVTSTGGGKAGATVAGTLTATVAAGKLKLLLGGKPVSKLPAGKYTVVVTDSSRKDGFTLQRIGWSRSALTGASFVGKHTATVDLKAGHWKYYSSASPSRGVLFTVSAK